MAGDTNGLMDIFVFDRTTRTTVRVNVTSAGQQTLPTDAGPFGSWSSGASDPSISDDGRFVAFSDDALVLSPADARDCGFPGGPRFPCRDIFRRDLANGTTVRVSVQPNGTPATGQTGSWGTALSGDGNFVAFASDYPTLVPHDRNHIWDIFLRDIDDE